MSTKYFRQFQKLYYRFGDNESPVIFQNLSQYVDLIDQIKTNISFFQDYTILSKERPDTTSFKLYDTPEYYWTFFLLNDKLRESGWPLSNEDVRRIAQEYYPHRVVTTKEDIATEPFDFPVGKVVLGSVSGTVGTIIKRNLDLGQLTIDTTNTVISEEREITLSVNTNGFAEFELTDDRETFHSPSLWTVYRDGNIIPNVDITLSQINQVANFANIPFVENSTYTVDALINIANPLDNNYGDTESLYYIDETTGITIAAQIYDEKPQYLATHHYEDANGDWVDIDPFTQVIPTGATAVTNLDRIQRKNDDLKQIKVIKPSAIETVVGEFYRLLSELT